MGAVVNKPEPVPTPPKPVPSDEVKTDTITNPTSEKEDQPTKADDVRKDEPVPTDSTKTPEEDKKPTEKEKNDEEDIALNPEQKDIDKIAEELINGSKVDERDLADIGSMLEGSYPVTISLNNGLEVVGFPFRDWGLDLVLTDLDGDGVFGDVLVNNNGELMRFDMPVTLGDGRVVGYDELIASLHITFSDIEQLLNNGGADNNLAMTEDDRQRLEADHPNEDIVNWEKKTAESENKKDGGEHEVTGGLTPEEEDELLKDILGENISNDSEIDDGELTALLTGTPQVRLISEEEETIVDEIAMGGYTNTIDNPEL